MRSWLAAGKNQWCIVELPPVHPQDFMMKRVGSWDKVYRKATQSSMLPEHVFTLPSDHVKEKEGHKIASAYVHLRALRCLVSRCHRCVRNATWFLVSEDDVLPSTSKATWGGLPSALSALLSFIDASQKSFFREANRLHLVSLDQSPFVSCHEYTPGLISHPQLSIKLAQCTNFADAKAYLIRRDQAERVLVAQQALLQGATNCSDPWHGSHQSCGYDPSVFNHNFGRCHKGPSTCTGRSVFIHLRSSLTPASSTHTHFADVFRHVNTDKYTKYKQFKQYSSVCGNAVVKGGQQLMDSQGCKVPVL